MAKALFVTGTGTDVGKTYVTALMVKKLEESGKNAAYYKAAMSGNRRRSDGSLIPGDAMFVQQTRDFRSRLAKCALMSMSMRGRPIWRRAMREIPPSCRSSGRALRPCAAAMTMSRSRGSGRAFSARFAWRMAKRCGWKMSFARFSCRA